MEKLTLICFYNFHREHSLLKLVIKKLSLKINVTNIKTRVKFRVIDDQSATGLRLFYHHYLNKNIWKG